MKYLIKLKKRHFKKLTKVLPKKRNQIDRKELILKKAPKKTEKKSRAYTPFDSPYNSNEYLIKNRSSPFFDDDDEEKDEKYALLEEKVSELQKENEALLEFKHKVERKEKEALIEQFSVILAEEDLKDVKENIDKYSCSEIESKLSVTCVRKKVSFDSLKEDSTSTTGTEDDVVSYTITDGDVSSSTPAWVKSVRRTQEENK